MELSEEAQKVIDAQRELAINVSNKHKFGNESLSNLLNNASNKQSQIDMKSELVTDDKYRIISNDFKLNSYRPMQVPPFNSMMPQTPSLASGLFSAIMQTILNVGALIVQNRQVTLPVMRVGEKETGNSYSPDKLYKQNNANSFMLNSGHSTSLNSSDYNISTQKLSSNYDIIDNTPTKTTKDSGFKARLENDANDRPGIYR